MTQKFREIERLVWRRTCGQPPCRRTSMKPSIMLSAVGCAAMVLAATPSAFAQRGGGGGHGGFGGGHMGGGFGGGHMMGGGVHMSGAPGVRGWGGPTVTRGGVGRPMPMGPVMGS